MAYLSETDISCGINELSDVGGTGEKQLKNTLKGVGVSAGIVLASLTTKQKAAEKLLLKNDFKKVGKAVRNPNTDNMINLFVLYPNRKKRKTTKKKKAKR